MMNKMKKIMAFMLMTVMLVTLMPTMTFAQSSTITTLGEGSLHPTLETKIEIDASKGDFSKIEHISLVDNATKKVVCAKISYELKGSKFIVTIYPYNNFNQNKTYTLKLYTPSNAYIYTLKTDAYVNFNDFKTQTRDIIVGYSNTQNHQGGVYKKVSLKRIEVPANPSKGFYFPYFLEIPIGTDGKYSISQYSKYLMVIPNNTLPVNSAKYVEEVFEKDMYGNVIGLETIGALEMPLLMPTFPRSSNQNDMVDPHFLNIQAVKLTKTQSDALGLGNLVDTEKQLVAMIADAKEQFKANGITLNPKVVLNGFSASGKFVNRFSLIYPELVDIVIGGTTEVSPMLPYSELNGTKLNYPLGVNDMKTLFGKDFNLAEYRKIKQFWYLGQDDWSEVLYHRWWFTESEEVLIKKYLGEDMFKRYIAIDKLMENKGVTIQFHRYQGIGHTTTPLMEIDFTNFLKANLGKDTLTKIDASKNGSWEQ